MVRITNEKIKLYIWFALGGVAGLADFLPALDDASESLDELADGKLAVAIALNGTSNCGINGSNIEMDNLVISTEGGAEGLNYVAAILAEETDSNGQLAIVGGNLSKLTEAFRFLAKKVRKEARDLKRLAKRIAFISIKNVAKLVKALKDEVGGVIRLKNSISALKGPSILITQLGTLLTSFNNGVQEVSKNVYILEQSTISGQDRCNISDTGIPGVLGDIVTETSDLSNILGLL